MVVHEARHGPAPHTGRKPGGSGTLSADIDTLKRLLALDGEAHEARQAIARKEKALAEDRGGLAKAEAVLEDTRAQVRELKKMLDKRNLEIKRAEDHIERLQGQLLNLSSASDMATMQRQIDAKTEEHGALEDKALEMMEVLESAEGRIPEREQALEERRSRLAAEEAEFKEANAASEAKAAKAEAEAAAVAAQLPAELKQTFDALRKRYPGKAIAGVTVRGECGGCQMGLTLNVQSQVTAGKVATCPSCQRLLLAETT